MSDNSSKILRDKSIDILKGIGIILMVIGHSGCPVFLHRFIYLFRMPLFFFITGYLFSDKYYDDPKSFYKNKFKGLYLTFIKWELLFLALHNRFAKMYLYKTSYTLFDTMQLACKTIVLSAEEELLGGFRYLQEAFIACLISFTILLGLKRLRIANGGQITMLLSVVICVIRNHRFFTLC